MNVLTNSHGNPSNSCWKTGGPSEQVAEKPRDREDIAIPSMAKNLSSCAF